MLLPIGPLLAATHSPTDFRLLSMRSKTVIVTGAAKRLGRAITMYLARAGWDVAIHYGTSRSEAESVAQEVEQLGRRAVLIQADLASPDVGIQVVSAAQAALGPIRALVNSASVFEFDEADSFKAENWDHAFAVNLRAPTLLSQAFANQGESLEDRCIINILDQKTSNLNPDFFSYTATKLALEGVTRLSAMAWQGRVRVLAIAPGLCLPSGDQTEEDFQTAHATAPLGRGSTPADISALVAYCLEAPLMSGRTITVDGGQHLQPRNRDVMFEARAEQEV